MVLKPADDNTGIVFIRTDLEENNIIKASYDKVSDTMLGTTISNDADHKVSTIEHLMAALWSCGVDNAVIEIDGPEIPVMDGSSEPFVFLIECAGIKEQQSPRSILQVLKKKRVTLDDGSYLEISPSDSFKVSVAIDFEHPVVGNQVANFDFSGDSFKRLVSRARTFGFKDEVNKLQQMGLARGGSLENAVVIGDDDILNPEGLRYSDEFARHKVLDCVGDLFLSGHYLRGEVSGYRSGHKLNNMLLRALLTDDSAYCFVKPSDIIAMIHIPKKPAKVANSQKVIEANRMTGSRSSGRPISYKAVSGKIARKPSDI